MKHSREKLVFGLSLAGLLAVNVLGLGSSINASSEITIHSGDTLAGLAQKYHVPVSEIERANHLHGEIALVSGHKLILPNQTDQNISSNTQDSSAKQNTEDSKSNNSSSSDNTSSSSVLSPQERAAKDWIAYHESRGEYHVSNGRYYGKFELDISLLKGDYSKSNQNRTADKYVHHRYGSWVSAKHFWETHNWY